MIREKPLAMKQNPDVRKRFSDPSGQIIAIAKSSFLLFPSPLVGEGRVRGE
jgi:hypothetical protein